MEICSFPSPQSTETLKHLLYITLSCFIDPEPYPNCPVDLLDFWRWRPSTKNRAFTTASWLEATKLSSKSMVFSAACFVRLWSLRYAWMWGHPCCAENFCAAACWLRWFEQIFLTSWNLKLCWHHPWLVLQDRDYPSPLGEKKTCQSQWCAKPGTCNSGQITAST